MKSRWCASLPMLLALAALAPVEASAQALDPMPPAAEAPKPRFQWDVPDIIQAIGVPGVTLVNGMPVTMQAVVSKWSIDPLAGHLIQQFERAGLFIPPEHQQPKGSVYAQLTAIDPETMLSYTVIFQPNKDGSTTLLLGVADVSRNPAKTADTFAPVFPGGSEVVQTRIETMQNLVYKAKAQPAEVLAYYREVLPAAGYREVEAGQFQSADTRLSVLTRANEDGTVSVTVNQAPSLPLAVDGAP